MNENKEKRIKKNITGATPSKILEYLMVYKEGVEVPISDIEKVLSALPKGNHFFAMCVKNKKVYLEYSQTT